MVLHLRPIIEPTTAPTCRTEWASLLAQGGVRFSTIQVEDRDVFEIHVPDAEAGHWPPEHRGVWIHIQFVADRFVGIVRVTKQ